MGSSDPGRDLRVSRGETVIGAAGYINERFLTPIHELKQDEVFLAPTVRPTPLTLIDGQTFLHY